MSEYTPRSGGGSDPSALKKTNNLSDVTDAAAARSAIGALGTDDIQTDETATPSDSEVPSTGMMSLYVDANAGGTAKSILGVSGYTGQNSDGGVTVAAGGTLYTCPFDVSAAGGGFAAAESRVGFAVPYACTLKNLYVVTGDSTGATDVHVTVRKNGVDTSLTVEMAATADTAASDTTHSVNFAQGDILSISIHNNDISNPSAPLASITLECDAQ